MGRQVGGLGRRCAGAGGQHNARLTAGLLAWAADGLQLGILRLEARKTPLPNGGWPMAAMALALAVSLSKPGVYTLNPGGRAVQVGDLVLAQKYASNMLLALIPWALAAIVLIAIVQSP
jgi:adenosylcobinamide-phosphate synthase